MLRNQLLQRPNSATIKQLSKSADTLDLYRLTFDSDPLVAWHAAWVLTHKSDAQIALLPQQELINQTLSTNNVSLRRLLLSLIERQKIDINDLRTDFLDFCLNGITSLEQPAGVQALCMKLSHRMCSFYPELLHEFIEVLKMMHPEHYSAGVRHVRNKYLKQLT